MTVVKAVCVIALLGYALLIALVFHRARRRPAARYFLLYLAGMMVWQLGYSVVAFMRLWRQVYLTNQSGCRCRFSCRSYHCRC